MRFFGYNRESMLLTGPPGSGKTSRVLAELISALARGQDPRPILIVPTASMAEHTQHRIARQGILVPPKAILPLQSYIEQLTPASREASAAAEQVLLEAALRLVDTSEFGPAAEYPGFQRILLDTIQEFWSAGADPGAFLEKAEYKPYGAPFLRIMREFENQLHAAGYVTRAERFRMAAAELGRQRLKSVFLDGFFHFTAMEQELVKALAGTAEKILITLPETGAEQARQALLAMGLPEERLTELRRLSKPVLVRAFSPEGEIEDVAGRILTDQKKTGRPFYEYGVILRDPEAYAPIVAVVFERFGIPFRLKQPQPLTSHSAIRYLTGLLHLAAGGFDGEAALAVMKLAPSGIAFSREMDGYEFEVRKSLPGRGLPFLLALAERRPLVLKWIGKLEQLADWNRERLAPADWASRCEGLARTWLRAPVVKDGLGNSPVLELRAWASAADAWRASAREASELLATCGTKTADLPQYLEMLSKVLRAAPLRVADRRRNVVQVLSVYEARQWELAVVFVCGLIEKQFPRYHPQNLFFPDVQRRALSAQGLVLRTSDDRDREERFLFDLALTRATEQVYASYPAHDDKGAETVRSFFLEPWKEQEVPAQEARFAGGAQVPSGPVVWAQKAVLRDPGLLQVLGEQPSEFSPSGLQKYIQCPFQFFAARILRLQEPPPKPDERLDAMLQGKIIHQTIAQWMNSRDRPIREVGEEVLRQTCDEEHIRLNFRAEAMKLQLLADLERFAESEAAASAPAGYQAGEPEKSFRYTLAAGAGAPVCITGRIDRHELSSSAAAIVTDYKYSRADRITELVKQHEKGEALQGWLYLLGLKNELGVQPAGLVFYGLRKEICRKGWYVPELAPAGDGLEEASAAQFQQMLGRAEARALEIVQDLRKGRIEVAPRDRRLCRDQCPYLDVCRVDL
ncbi:MAG TPA: PD-(D/E)XK nuclease family protein [Bryobacterales bacterium]|nr:PD-(D/E)XK nuclease family protein [Bryobacterales bacterium]